MAKKKTKKSASKKTYTNGGGWAGFTPFQLIVIFSVFLIFALFVLL